jgi:hypothetical protein
LVRSLAVDPDITGPHYYRRRGGPQIDNIGYATLTCRCGCSCGSCAWAPSGSERTCSSSPVCATTCPRTPWAPGRSAGRPFMFVMSPGSHRGESAPPDRGIHADRARPMHRLDRFERRQQHPQPAHPRFSGESAVWREEHTASADPTQGRFGVIGAGPVSVSPNRLGDQRFGPCVYVVPDPPVNLRIVWISLSWKGRPSGCTRSLNHSAGAALYGWSHESHGRYV